jgi:hypothetical protein
MKVRKHFRTSSATIDYIIADFSLNRITNKKEYFVMCINSRIKELNQEYNDRVDRILNFIIMHSSYDNMPLACVSKIIFSLSKVTNALTRGILYLIGE